MAIKKSRQKGFAIIFVMVFIALIMSIVSDVVYQTQITAKNSLVQQDQIFAKLAVKTGLEFGKFIIILNKLTLNYQNNPLIPIPKNIYKVLNGQPIGAESFDKIKGLTGIDFSTVLSPEIKTGLKAMKGYFVLKVTSENTKFNLNLLNQSTYSMEARNALMRIFSHPDTTKFLAIYGYTPVQIVNGLLNYIKISVTDSSVNAIAMEQYNKLGLTYLPKHAALESLEELRRIPGFEVDDIYNMFSPYFTVWPINVQAGSLNINTASPELVSAIMTPQTQDPNEQGWDKFEDYRQQNSFAINTMKEFFTKNLPDYASDSETELIRKNIFGITDTVYKIECRGVYNNVEKNFLMVLQLNQSASSSTGGGTGTGTGSGSGTGTGTNASNPTPIESTSVPFHILYSQWID